MKDKVSVIVPVYNAQNYIEVCVKSIINQTYSNIEIILLNDGSTDESYKLMKKLEKKDSRIKLISRENKGTLYTRLEGVNIATGKYIMYVDSDDYIENNMIEKLLQENNNADVIRCDYIIENLKKKKKEKEVNFYKKKTILENSNFIDLYYIYLKTYQYSGICAQLIKRELFNNITFEKSVNMCEDLYINLEIISQAKKIVFLPEAYYHYIIRENSTCTTLNKEKMKKRIEDCIHIYSKLFDYINKWNIENDNTKAIVANRIIEEAFMQIRNLFFVSFTKKEILEILNNVLENAEFNKARILANKRNMSFYEKRLYKGQYKTFYMLANITIKPMYFIKEKVKQHIYK